MLLWMLSTLMFLLSSLLKWCKTEWGTPIPPIPMLPTNSWTLTGLLSSNQQLTKLGNFIFFFPPSNHLKDYRSSWKLSPFRQLVQGASVNMSALQQIHSRNQQPVIPFHLLKLHWFMYRLSLLTLCPTIFKDMKGDAAMSQRSMPTDPSTLYGSGMMQPKSGLVSTGELIAITQLFSLFLYEENRW